MKKYISSILMFGIICAPIKPPIILPPPKITPLGEPLTNNNNGNNTSSTSGSSASSGNSNNNSITTQTLMNHPGGCAPYIPGTSIHYQCWYDAQATIALLNGTPKVVPHVLPPHPTNTPAPLPKPIYHKNSKG